MNAPGVLRIVALLIALLLAGPLEHPAVSGESQAPGEGTIEGRVILQTEQTEAVAGAVVKLHVFADQNRVETMSQVTGQDGRFSFQGLDTSPDKKYILTTEFAGVLYFGARTTFEETKQAERDLVVYDTTTDDSALKVLHEHIILGFRPGAVEVSQVFVIANSGKRTIVSRELPGGINGTLRLMLPQGAFAFEELQGLMGAQSTKADGGIVYDSPIVPGTIQLAFRYRLPYQGVISVEKIVDYPTEAIDVVVEDTGVAVTAEGMEPKRSITIEGQQYLHFQRSALVKGARIAVGLTAVQAPFSQRTFLVLMAACAVGLGIIGYVYPLAWVRSRAASDVVSGERAWASKYRQDAASRLLVQEIAELDDLYYKGMIRGGDYHPARAAKKEQLLSILSS